MSLRLGPALRPPATRTRQGARHLTAGLLLAGLSACTDSTPALPLATSPHAAADSGSTSAPGDELELAVGSMLSAVATFEAYDALFADMSRAVGRPYRLIQRRSYQEVNSLLVAGAVDLAFICSGPYVALPKDAPVEIAVVPVVDAVSTYHSLVVVRADSPAKSFADLAGGRFAFTDPLSHTGYVYPMSRVLALHQDPKRFFAATLFTGSHDRSLRAVAAGVADAAAVSSLGFYLTVVPDSPFWGQLRVLEKSPAYAIPPVVVSTRSPVEVRRALRDFLLGLDKSAAGRAHLKRLGIDRFVLPPANLDYGPVRALSEAVSAALR